MFRLNTPPSRYGFFISGVIFIFLVNPASKAADRNLPIEIPRIDAKIILDGFLNESIWEDIPVLELRSHWPEQGKRPVSHAEMRLAYDDNFLYLGAICHDGGKNRQAPTYKRDAWGMHMDQVAIVVDSYNDYENALVFVVTPTGSRIDVVLKNDLASSDYSLTWDGYWDAEVSRNDTAWSAEIRIPFSSLKFQSKADEVIMGITVYNYRAHGTVMDSWPEISDKWGFWSFAKPSQTQRVRFHAIDNAKPLYISPYVLGGWQQSNEINDVETAAITDNNAKFEAGLDIKYAVTDNLTLDLTVNTDFAQVEADDAQINLTRYSLFFPEKRRFFLERESNFNFSFGGFDQLFYSRRIGLVDDQLVRILGGARLVGRAGKWDIGIMNLQTGRKDDLPTENFGVYRTRRQVFNSQSYMGGIITSRIAEDGYYNIAYGLDGIFHVTGDEYFTYTLGQSIDQELNKKVSGFDASRISISWERRTFQGLSYQVDVDYGGRNYNPGMGFELRSDYSGLSANAGYGWLPGENSKLERINVNFSGEGYLNNADRTPESITLGPKFSFYYKNSMEFGGGTAYHREHLTDTFRLSDAAWMLPGTYNFEDIFLYYNTPQGKNIRFYTDVFAGGFFDGYRISAGASPSWNVSSHLELSGFYGYNYLWFGTRDQSYLAHIARFKILVSINTKLELSSYIQYNSAVEGSIINFRLRYNYRDGNDLYLVYNESGDLQRRKYDFNAPMATYRAILVKYVHTFRL